MAAAKRSSAGGSRGKSRAAAARKGIATAEALLRAKRAQFKKTMGKVGKAADAATKRMSKASKANKKRK